MSSTAIRLGLLFPRKLINRVHGLADTLGKSLDFNFMGLITPQRAWVYAFDSYSRLSKEKQLRSEAVSVHSRTSLVRQSLKGRNSRKYLFDFEYFSILATSRFTLCPIGDFKWSYRFFEAIMAMSIPVLSSAEKMDIHAEVEGYFYYKYTPPAQNSTIEVYQLAHDEQVRNFHYSHEKAGSKLSDASSPSLAWRGIGGKDTGFDYVLTGCNILERPEAIISALGKVKVPFDVASTRVQLQTCSRLRLIGSEVGGKRVNMNFEC